MSLLSPSRAPPPKLGRKVTDKTPSKKTRVAALETEAGALKLEIAQKEEQLLQQRRQENNQAAGAKGKGKGKGKASPLDLDLVSGELGQEDWTINERGEVRPLPPSKCRSTLFRAIQQEALNPGFIPPRTRAAQVINEEGLPMFDIHEDLPPDDPVSASSRDDKLAGGSGAGGQAPPTRRYLIKKGGKQTIGAVLSFLSLSFLPFKVVEERGFINLEDRSRVSD